MRISDWSSDVCSSDLDQEAPIATVEELPNYDAIIVGTGTRYGRISSQMASFLDQTGGLWARGALNGKVGAAFSSRAPQHGGKETTLVSIITHLLHFGMTIAGLDYEIGRAQCRENGCQYVYISVSDVSIKKKNMKYNY